MPSIRNDKLQALRHVEARARAEVEVSGLPLDRNEVLQLFHRLGVMSVDAALEVIPEQLDRVEIRTPRRKVEDVHSMVVEPGAGGASGVRRRIVLLIS